MAGQELAAAVVNDANKTKRSNPVPGRVDTEDNNNERDSSCISTDLIHQPANNEVTGDVRSIRKIKDAARRRKEKPLASRRDDMKATFEAQRKKVLDRVPEDYKNMFGQAGFIGWGQAVLPALIVSPYSVPRGIGSPREKWLKMLDILEQHGRLKSLAYILYWYGAKSPADSYSFVTKSAFVGEASEDYQKHMKTLETAQAEVDSNENVPMATQELARKYKEMQNDLGKPPEDRKHGGFQEIYELLSMSDVDELISDSDESGGDDTGEEKAEPKPAPKKRDKASKADGDDIDDTLESERKKKMKKTPPVTVCKITEALEQPSVEQRTQSKQPVAKLVAEPKRE